MIRRTLYTSLKAHLNQKEITLIVGPRQAGKTTLMQVLKKELDNAGEKTVFLNLDIETDRSFFDSQQDLLKKIELEIGKNKGYVFIDEIQRKENAGVFLKGLYDMNLPYKFIVSGSGSVELKEKVHESLAGRKQVFEVTTISFEEFVNHKTDYRYQHSLASFFELHADQGRSFLNEYVNFGGYPRVVLAQTNEAKQNVITDIYQSYLEKDIAYLLNIQKTDRLIQLVKILSAQTGNLVNVSELSSTIGLAVQTVNDYLWYLEKTFVIRKVTPYFKNIRKEITKMCIYYFNDLGLKNYATGQFGIATEGIPSGFLFENFVYNNLYIQLNTVTSGLNFWRTQDKAEVDFILQTAHGVIPIEVKYQSLQKPETTRSFKSFLNKYHPTTAYVVHLGKILEDQYNNTRILFIPYFKTVDFIELLRKEGN